ncbi:unnamed protein product, partial [Scytosiphon promiscuus]
NSSNIHNTPKPLNQTPTVSRTPWLLLVGQAILPKLTRGVTEWDPRTDTVLIHTWIHPWLPLLGSRVAGKFQGVDRWQAVVVGWFH